MSESSWPRIPEAAWHWRASDPMPAEPEPAHASLHDGGVRQGLAIGGLGTGAVGRDPFGAFRRWTLKAGVVKSFCDPVNGFAAFQRRSGAPPHACALHPGHPHAPHTAEPEASRPLAGWNWALDPARLSYHALFPKAWYRYAGTEDAPAEMLCEQFSPVLPHDYRASSLPVGVFRWHLHNPADAPVTLALLFSFMNVVGWFHDFERAKPGVNRRPGQWNAPFERPATTTRPRVAGLRLTRELPDGEIAEGDGELALAAGLGPDDALFTRTAFDAAGDGAAVWRPFAEAGRLEEAPAWTAGHWQDLAGAVAVRLELAPGETRCLPMALTWDLPEIRFGGGRRFRRKHTDFFGAGGGSATAIAAEAIEHHAAWSRRIDAWHRRTLERSGRPAWFDSMRFNECYLLTEGGTVWTAASASDEPNRPDGTEHFGILECPDYPFYCTLDLWVYGSFVVLAHWPELEKRVLRDFAAATPHEDATRRIWLWNGELCARKLAGALPHDLGAHNDDPFARSNTYQWQDPNRWKDLNPQFVLLVYRDFLHTRDEALLRDCYPAVREAMRFVAAFDRDGDGLIENEGVPDQTYDSMRFEGPSAYCNGLYLGALEATARLAEHRADPETARWARERLERGRAAFERTLWTGTHYRADTASALRDRVFIDQLFGVWFARRCGIDGIVAPERYRTALATIHARNFLPYRARASGAATLDRPPAERGDAQETAFNPEGTQIAEVMSGINLGLACQLDDAGLAEEAEAVFAAIHRAVYRDRGLWFRTPAAWNEAGQFRAIMNLRPLVIWAA